MIIYNYNEGVIMETIRLGKEYIEEAIKCLKCAEASIVKRFGDKKGRELLDKILDRIEEVHVPKLNDSVMLVYSLRKEAPPNMAMYYEIKAQDKEGKEIGELKYKLYDSLCTIHLCYIGVTDKEYQGKGIGYLLLSKMEDIAKEIEIPVIEGHFQPLGDLASFSRKFYERNGYEIEFDYCDRKPCLYKRIKEVEVYDEMER